MTEDELHERKFSLAEMLNWRGIQCYAPRDLVNVCPTCGGSGVRAYASTSLWRGGVGGQMISSGVCDNCWGSGDITRKGADLRKLMKP